MRLKGYVRVGDPVPVSVQNLVIRDYCRRRGHTYLLSDVEFVWGGTSMWEGLMANLGNFDGVVAYSLFQVPRGTRCEKPIHFALEDYELPGDAEAVELAWVLK